MKPLAPIVAASRERLNVQSILVELEPVAVEFDFVEPIIAGWYAVRKRCQAWRHKARLSSALNAGQLCRDYASTGVAGVLPLGFRKESPLHPTSTRWLSF